MKRRFSTLSGEKRESESEKLRSKMALKRWVKTRTLTDQ